MLNRSTSPVSYVEIIESLPQDLQMPMLKLVEAVERDLREQLAVRRQDIDDLRAVVAELAEAQRQSEARLSRLEVVVTELAEAQRQSEVRLSRLEATVAELIEAQKRTEQRVEELAEAQRQTEARLSRLEVVVTELAEAQKRTEERVQELAEAQRRTELEVRGLSERQRVMADQLGRTVGRQLEQYYRDKAYAYFGRILRKTQVLSFQELEPTLEPLLDEDELEDVRLLDLVVRGRATGHPQTPEVLLAFEISAVVDPGDVERALRRAALLRRAGYVVVPTVAGEDATEDAREAARDAGVLLVQDGRKEFWDAALAAALAA